MCEEPLIEWDVKLWTYVIYYKGKKYELGISNIREAYERFELIKYGLEKNENTVY